MCGRFTFTQPNSVFERFHVEPIDPPLSARFNISPSQKMPVIVKKSPNHLELMTWGFTPKWADKPLINAKAETIDDKAIFMSFID